MYCSNMTEVSSVPLRDDHDKFQDMCVNSTLMENVDKLSPERKFLRINGNFAFIAAQSINLMISLGCAVYFTRYDHYKAMNYLRLCWICIIGLIFHCVGQPLGLLWKGMAIVLIAYYCAIVANVESSALGYGQKEIAVSMVCIAVNWGVGLIVSSTRVMTSSQVDLDVILYSTSLIFTNLFIGNEFYPLMFLLLDLRLYLMIYTELCQPQNKLELLLARTFVLVNILLVICYLVLMNSFHASNILSGFAILGFIGLLLLLELMLGRKAG